MNALHSYVRGDWIAGSGDPVQLHDPSTEEVLATTRPSGVDFAAVLQHARKVGGPALRALSWKERGAILNGLAKKLHEHRDELIEISARNGGNTRGDAKFDLDGASGTLAYYGKLAAELPDTPWLIDGAGVQLGRTARFWAEHVLMPRPGVGVHINAFNFPAWGMAEKMACALLAGTPVVSKAGTCSAMLAERVAKIVVDSGLVPEGGFQFLCGAVSGLLDHLDAMDLVAFTGSAKTGSRIRGNPNLIARSVRVNIEADSINSAVLGPDAELDGDTFTQFVTNVAIDMTQKAGQKCTAVRRILVPLEHLDAVKEALVERLEATRIGNVMDEQVRMGPVASKAQLDDVRAGIKRLQDHCATVLGGAEPMDGPGYFVKPTLLQAKDAGTDLLHELEVFGPCATILPYDGKAATATELVNRGGGCLVASVYSDDKTWLGDVVPGIAPWHGRVWIGSEKTMGQALGPGAVLPGAIHGGPGRAGGGEELGGLRGLQPYLMRTAVQGDRAVLGKTFGIEG
ncbi:MAG: 3,4-dehydroadipyl-CoA semialdehyde dehydrogenase [Planctomycetes bacterium]|nr:3,4-dehydroadipyl-CoA semialdehyde dehydrogenase [Planctomycetota bacterium]